MVELFKIEDEKDEIELRKLIENHLNYTSSKVADMILSDWNNQIKNFIKVFPTDYRRVLEENQNEIEELTV